MLLVDAAALIKIKAAKALLAIKTSIEKKKLEHIGDAKTPKEA